MALLSLTPTTSWDQVRDLTAAAVAAAGELPPRDDGALFALARTLLATTGGSVSIEDSAHRVLAYARGSRRGGRAQSPLNSRARAPRTSLRFCAAVGSMNACASPAQS